MIFDRQISGPVMAGYLTGHRLEQPKPVPIRPPKWWS